MKNITMKKTFLTLVALSCITLLWSCKKEDDANPSNNNTGGATFNWTDNTGATVNADSAFYVEQYHTIKAYKGGIAQFIEINLTAGAAGTYTVGSGNAISYLNGNTLYTASTGSVVISSNTAGKMAGSFTSTGTGGSITALSGAFANMEVR
jgi:hypothetical protein